MGLGKDHSREENNTFKIADVKQLTEKTLAEVTRDHWREARRHSQDSEDKFSAEDGLQDAVAELIIEFDGDSDELDTDGDL